MEVRASQPPVTTQATQPTPHPTAIQPEQLWQRLTLTQQQALFQALVQISGQLLNHPPQEVKHDRP